MNQGWWWWWWWLQHNSYAHIRAWNTFKCETGGGVLMIPRSSLYFTPVFSVTFLLSSSPLPPIPPLCTRAFLFFFPSPLLFRIPTTKCRTPTCTCIYVANLKSNYKNLRLIFFWYFNPHLFRKIRICEDTNWKKSFESRNEQCPSLILPYKSFPVRRSRPLARRPE